MSVDNFARSLASKALRIAMNAVSGNSVAVSGADKVANYLLQATDKGKIVRFNTGGNEKTITIDTSFGSPTDVFILYLRRSTADNTSGYITAVDLLGNFICQISEPNIGSSVAGRVIEIDGTRAICRAS